jgi:outer membrane protein assembly factor BamA
VRAFLARTVGPGTYQPPDSLANIYVDQVGDLKLEVNAEYRFGITGMLKGALFIDAGNIWLVNDDTTRPGGLFNYQTFLKELAVGTGFGFRLDAEFFILRIDLAFPLRIPSLPEGERWVINEFAINKKSWRRENLIWNFSIGYPF